MLRIVIICGFFIAAQSFWANASIDSLKAAITHKNDSSDCKTYQRLCFEYLNKNLDSAKHYGEKALSLAKEIGREKSIISSKNALGMVGYYQSNFIVAKSKWIEALHSSKQFGIDDQVYQLLVRLGIANSNLGLNDSARVYFNKAKEIGVRENDSAKVITCLSNIAVEDFRQGFHDKAIPLNIEALNWYLNNYQKTYAYSISNTANNLSSSYVDFKDWNSAEKYARVGKKYGKIGNYIHGVLSANTLFGIIHAEQKQYDSAQLYYNLALHGLKNSPAIFNRIQLYDNKAQSFVEINRLDSAFNYYRKAIRLSVKIEAPINQAIATIGYGEAHFKKGNLDSALYYSKKGHDIAKKQEFNTDFMNGSKLLSAIYGDLQQFDSAYFYLDQYTELHDSLNSIESLQRINALERLNERKAQKEKLKRERAKNLLNTEKLALKERQNTYLIIFSVIILLALGALLAALFSLFKTRNRLTELNRQLTSEKENLTVKTNELNATNNTLKQTQSQLIQSEKLASLGQLTAGIAHEINNPINFVKAGIESLKLELDDIKKLIKEEGNSGQKELKSKAGNIDEMLNEIELIAQGITNGANRTAEIVKGLRIYARTSEDGKTNFNVKESIENTLLLLKNSYKDRIEIKTHFDSKTVIDGIGQKLDQVFMNLISNAIQAIEGKGEIEISSTVIGENLQVTIRDSGKGISEEHLNKIFDPFFTTKEVGKGTGLGLAISMGIVKEHNGTIDVQSEPGNTTFNVALPIKQ